MSTNGALLEKPQATEDPEVRVYRGRSIDELIPRIEAELGADAIVVRRTRGLEGGIGGFFQRRFVEVEAKAGTPRIDTYDEQDGEPVLPPPAPAPAPAVPRPNGAYVTDTLATIAASGFTAPPTEPEPTPEFTPEFTPESFDQALAQATSESDPFAEELDRLNLQLPAPLPLPQSDPPSPSPKHTPQPPVPGRARSRVETSLSGVGMSEAMAGELLGAAAAHILPLAPRTSMVRAAQLALAARIPAVPLLPAHSASVAVIGPGGSGKTSCCAALLGAYRRAGSLPASCATITLVGEREEPAMLLSPRVMEPMAVASAGARQILAQAREEGLLLLDMPPLSPADRSAVRRIAALLGELKPDRVVVALPATLGAKAAAQLLEALRPLGASAMAITHADETDQLGVAVEAACQFDLAPEYLLDRPRLRSGLARLTPTELVNRLLP